MSARTVTWVAVLALLGGAPIMGEQPNTQDEHQKKLEELKKATDLANAQAGAAEAKKKQLDAEKALADAAKRPTAEQAAAAEQAARAKTAKEVADAEKAAADARKAESEADLAAFKAAIGTVPDSGITGAVTAGTKAGDIEAHLLAMKAIKAAAAVVAGRITGATDVVIMTPAETPSFQNVMAYDAQLAIVHAALDNAIKAGTAFTRGSTEEAVPLLGAAGLALEGVTKLMSFFRSDITLNNVDVTVDDRVGVQEVASALTAKGIKVTAPTIYNRAALQSRADFVIKDAEALSTKRAKLAPLIAAAGAKSDELTKAIAAATDPTIKGTLEKALADVTALLTTLKGASALVDAWYTGLSAADGKGIAAVVHVTKEKAIADGLQKGLLLLVKVEKAGGAFMSKKNLWTFFGEMPVYHMGGAALSFTAIGGADGLVKAAGVVPIHGGFVKAGNVSEELARDEQDQQKQQVEEQKKQIEDQTKQIEDLKKQLEGRPK